MSDDRKISVETVRMAGAAWCDESTFAALLDAVKTLRGLVVAIALYEATGADNVDIWWERGNFALSFFDFGGES